MGSVYINQQIGNNNNPGSKEQPLMSLMPALVSPANNEIFIQDGIYTDVIDASIFDRVRRKIIGLGDVYIAAQGNPSSFNGVLSNNHLFKNIKFVNYTSQAIEFGGGHSVLSSCFFKPLSSAGSRAIMIGSAHRNRTTTLDIRKCTFINNESIFSINPILNLNVLNIINMQNSLFFGHTYQIKLGPNTFSFSTTLTDNQDKGNYYDNNIHLANGGIDSITGENPPLFVNPGSGNYDLIPSSTLVGAGYLGSDIGSFHDVSPFTSTPDEPISIFDAGWSNDNTYFNMFTNLPGIDGPSDAAGIIQMCINSQQQWLLDITTTPLGKSGRLISPLLDLDLLRTITRGSWAAEENILPPSGMRQTINNSNLTIANLEIRGDPGPFDPDPTNLTPTWMPFNRATNIGLVARYIQLRIVFRLDGV